MTWSGCAELARRSRWWGLTSSAAFLPGGRTTLHPTATTLMPVRPDHKGQSSPMPAPSSTPYPPVGSKEVSCACIGSSVPQDRHDVRPTVFGNPVGTGLHG